MHAGVAWWGCGGWVMRSAAVWLFWRSNANFSLCCSYVNGQGWAVDGGLSAGHPVVPGKLA